MTQKVKVATWIHLKINILKTIQDSESVSMQDL